MNPNQQASGLNIDQMLQNLQQVPTPVAQAEQTFAPVVEQVVHEPVVPEFIPTPAVSVEAIEKPIAPVIPTIPQKEAPAVSKNKFVFPNRLRIVAPSFLTVFSLIVVAWFMSIQYPEESRKLINGVTGVFSNLAGVTKSNMKPDGMVSLSGSDEQTHGVAQDDPYLLDSPLADAMDDASQQLPEDNKAEQLFDNVLSGSDETINNSIDFSIGSSSMEVVNTGNSSTGTIPASTYDHNFNLPSTTQLPTTTEFQQQLLTLSEQAESAMTNFIGNNDVSLAKMRVVYKNTQSMLEDLRRSPNITEEKVEQYNQLLTIYNGVVK